MFGLTQFSERQLRSAEASRAELALEAARVQPLEIQQEIARSALVVCARVMERLSTVPRSTKRDALVRLQFAELELKILEAALDADNADMAPEAIAAVLGQTLLAASTGTLPGKGLRHLGERIASWTETILPDFEQYRARLLH